MHVAAALPLPSVYISVPVLQTRHAAAASDSCFGATVTAHFVISCVGRCVTKHTESAAVLRRAWPAQKNNHAVGCISRKTCQAGMAWHDVAP